MLQDANWIARALDGDKIAFSMLVKKYQQQVYVLACQMLSNFEDAKDLTQEVFLTAYQKLSSLKQPDRFGSWLHTITINSCKIWQRKTKYQRLSFDLTIEEDGQVRAAGVFLSQHDDPATELEMHELYESIISAMNALPEVYRAVAMLFFINDMSYKDISDFLDIPISTIQSRVQQSRKLLKERMIKMAKDWFDIHKLPDDFHKKVLAETDAIQIGDMEISEPNWGRNVLSAKLTNKTERKQWVGLDVRSEVKEDRGNNWQTQFIYEVPPHEVKMVRESFDINWIFRDFDYYRGEGHCTLRISFALMPEDMLDNAGSVYLLNNHIFSKTYPLKVSPSSSMPKKVKPSLPMIGNVTLKNDNIPQPELGDNKFTASLNNHTERIQYVRIHIDVDGGGYGGGKSYELAPDESKEIEQIYHIYPGHERETGGKIIIRVKAVLMPENLPELNWDEAVNVWTQYALDYPDAIVYRKVFTGKLRDS